jgi:GNAT superfamily N-acetyltransferase
VHLRTLVVDDLSIIAAIDRSEHVDIGYAVIDGQLTEQPVVKAEIPPWDPTGSGPHSVATQIDFCSDVAAHGAVLIGAFDDERVVGLAVLDPSFEPRLAWLAFLHVSRPDRRRGVARALWDATTDLALAAGADSMYVSATPTGSAVGFYLRQGCRLADPVHPTLFAHEPDDIHLVCSLTGPSPATTIS